MRSICLTLFLAASGCSGGGNSAESTIQGDTTQAGDAFAVPAPLTESNATAVKVTGSGPSGALVVIDVDGAGRVESNISDGTFCAIVPLQQTGATKYHLRAIDSGGRALAQTYDFSTTLSPHTTAAVANIVDGLALWGYQSSGSAIDNAPGNMIDGKLDTSYTFEPSCVDSGSCAKRDVPSIAVHVPSADIQSLAIYVTDSTALGTIQLYWSDLDAIEGDVSGERTFYAMAPTSSDQDWKSLSGLTTTALANSAGVVFNGASGAFPATAKWFAFAFADKPSGIAIDDIQATATGTAAQSDPAPTCP